MSSFHGVRVRVRVRVRVSLTLTLYYLDVFYTYFIWLQEFSFEHVVVPCIKPLHLKTFLRGTYPSEITTDTNTPPCMARRPYSAGDDIPTLVHFVESCLWSQQ